MVFTPFSSTVRSLPPTTIYHNIYPSAYLAYLEENIFGKRNMEGEYPFINLHLNPFPCKKNCIFIQIFCLAGQLGSIEFEFICNAFRILFLC